MVVCEGDEIQPEHLAPTPRSVPAAAPDAGSSPHPPAAASLVTLAALERGHIEQALRATGGHRSQTARILGISERNLYRKLKDYGLPT